MWDDERLLDNEYIPFCDILLTALHVLPGLPLLLAVSSPLLLFHLATAASHKSPFSASSFLSTLV
jgi:hypothetical protein